jgi:ubiquitin carboxyl-terminal hydrolase 14
VTDELKEKLARVRHRLKELKETRVERRHESRRNKGGAALFTRTFSQGISTAMSSETGRATIGIYDSDIQRAIREENEVLEDEMTIQARERREVEELVDQELRDDVGSSVSGMYDLVGVLLHLIPPLSPFIRHLFFFVSTVNRFVIQ